MRRVLVSKRPRAAVAAGFAQAGLAIVVALAASSLVGCASQIDSLAPVSGDDVSAVRAATTDVLLAQQVDILEAPVCAKSETAITCEGKLTNGSTVSVDAPLDAPDTMTVTVAGEVIYEGSIQDVLSAAAGGAQ